MSFQNKCLKDALIELIGSSIIKSSSEDSNSQGKKMKFISLD